MHIFQMADALKTLYFTCNLCPGERNESALGLKRKESGRVPLLHTKFIFRLNSCESQLLSLLCLGDFYLLHKLLFILCIIYEICS